MIVEFKKILPFLTNAIKVLIIILSGFLLMVLLNLKDSYHHWFFYLAEGSFYSLINLIIWSFIRYEMTKNPYRE